MSRQPKHFHCVFWTAAYCLWITLTKGNHPTWALRVLCTLVLIGASAVFACCFPTRRFGAGPVTKSAIASIGCGAAGIIHVFYDISIGPDPRRFSLPSNIAMDIAVVGFNTIVAAVMAWGVQILTGRPTWFVIQSDQHSQSIRSD